MTPGETPAESIESLQRRLRNLRITMLSLPHGNGVAFELRTRAIEAQIGDRLRAASRPDRAAGAGDGSRMEA